MQMFEREEEIPGMSGGEFMLYPYNPESSDGLPGGTIWVASRWIYFAESGQYTMRIYADDFATVWLGKDSSDLSFAFEVQPTSPLASNDYGFYVTKGLKRIDIRVGNSIFVGEDNHPTCTALSIWRGSFPVYISRKEGWLATEGNFPADDAIPNRPDPKTFYPIFSVEPNWKGGMYERLSWFTDVLASDTNAEQRRALRTLPRRSVTAEYLRKGAGRSTLDSFLAGAGNSPCLMPLFHEPVRLPEGTGPDSTGIAFSGAGPAQREIREGSLVMVTAGDPDDYDLLRVGTVEPQRFSWGTYPTKIWPAGSVLYPVRVARVNGVTSMENVSSAVARMQIVFDYEDPDLGLAETPTPSPDQEILFQFPCNWRERLRYDYNRKIFTHDNQSGAPWHTDPGGDTFITTQFTVTMYGRAEVQRFRRFLGLMRGRSRAFYFLSPTDDLIPLGDIDGLSAELMVEDSGFSEYFFQRPQPIRRRIGLLVDNNSPEYRNIIGIGPNGGLLLDSPFPSTSRDKIVRIAFVSPARLDQDTVELRHYVGLSNAVEARVTIRQYGQRRVEIGA